MGWRARVLRGAAASMRPGLGRRTAVRISTAASQRRFLPQTGERVMNKPMLSLGIAMVLCMGAARAQVAGFDPATFQQNLLTAARTLAPLHPPLRLVPHETHMMVTQDRHPPDPACSTVQALRHAVGNARRATGGA